jgi:hypothetical protein
MLDNEVCVDALPLGCRIAFYAEHGETLVGEVRATSLIDEDPTKIRVRVRLRDSGSDVEFDWPSDHHVELC